MKSRAPFFRMAVDRFLELPSCWRPEGIHRERDEREDRAAISANGGEILPASRQTPVHLQLLRACSSYDFSCNKDTVLT